MKTRIVLCATLALVAAGCSESDFSRVQNVAPGQQIALVGGEYTGSYTATSIPTTDNHVTINQNGSALSGTYRAHSDTIQGTLTGTAGVNDFVFTFNQTKPCSGTFSGSGKVNDKSLTGDFSGSDCGGNQSGSFVISRP
jgi:hypothetical protein